MSVRAIYQPDNFRARVDFAADRISSGNRTTRNFDTCFEMGDGTAVALALYCRTQDRPNTRLARKIWDYLHRPTVERDAAEYADIVSMPRNQRNKALSLLSEKLRTARSP